MLIQSGVPRKLLCELWQQLAELNVTNPVLFGKNGIIKPYPNETSTGQCGQDKSEEVEDAEHALLLRLHALGTHSLWHTRRRLLAFWRLQPCRAEAVLEALLAASPAGSLSSEMTASVASAVEQLAYLQAKLLAAINMDQQLEVHEIFQLAAFFHFFSVFDLDILSKMQFVWSSHKKLFLVYYEE
ncbi:unnamed protein product [Protopolystoma xenopodis]|uniref:Uncharacterized protein n=1 Tax=Protopolystoma xenopodis TaxID=117903 RepID=A0A448WV35_9PLAT|nr:unnamed protein product [Protopolystoma xenopodis]